MGCISLCLLQRAFHIPFCGPQNIGIRGLLIGERRRSGVSVNKSTTLRVACMAEERDLSVLPRENATPKEFGRNARLQGLFRAPLMVPEQK
jgi:hypothetical protein